LDDQIKKNEVGGACDMYQEGRGFWWGNLRERDHLEDPGLDGRIILRWKWDGGAWTGLI
jgi:hypothetical protein